VALGLELVIPGAGFFYLGESRQGYAMLAMSVAAVATAVGTGPDGAAGWVPMAAWVKVASLAQVRDEARARNEFRRLTATREARGERRTPVLPLLTARLAF
jgi:hypothetical protein